MPYLNKVTLVGHVVRDMEVRYTQSGMKIGKFTLAVNEGYGEKKKAFFFDIVAFEKTVDWNEDKVRKGAAVLVDGKLNHETWDDKDTGQKRSRVSVIAHSLGVFSKGEKSEQTESQTSINDFDTVPF